MKEGGAKPSRTCTAALARVCGKCHKNVWSSFLDVSVGKHHVCRLAAQFPFWKVGLPFSKLFDVCSCIYVHVYVSARQISEEGKRKSPENGSRKQERATKEYDEMI